MSLLTTLKAYARSIGFDACGAAPCRPVPEAVDRIARWTQLGLHAGMGYMERNTDLRTDPARLFEGTKSVVVCLMSYKQETVENHLPYIAAYARGADYHYIVKEKLNRLSSCLAELSPGTSGRAFADSAPIAEKYWAVKAGLGWIGRNSLLIHPELGSQCFIGILLTTLEFDTYDTPFTANHCGSCRKCLDSCPSGAIRTGGLIDARRCLSYQTIENRREIPDELIPSLGNRLFGCDTCQDVCPWNPKAAPVNHPEFMSVPGLDAMTGDGWLDLGNGEFKRRFGHTPLARAGLKKLQLTLRQKTAAESRPYREKPEF